jgi:UDP-galactopyranose mutase
VAPAAPKPYDYLIVGAGFAGSVLAERLAADANKKVLVIDRRPHIAGNAFDVKDEAGVLMHQYGPHIFHTNSEDIFNYLGRSPSGGPMSTGCWRACATSSCPCRSTGPRSTSCST